MLKEVGKAITTVPEGFQINKKLSRVIDARKKPSKVEKELTGLLQSTLLWLIAFRGSSSRLSGQDSGRGTFSQRHSVFIDQISENRYIL